MREANDCFSTTFDRNLNTRIGFLRALYLYSSGRGWGWKVSKVIVPVPRGGIQVPASGSGFLHRKGS